MMICSNFTALPLHSAITLTKLPPNFYPCKTHNISGILTLEDGGYYDYFTDHVTFYVPQSYLTVEMVCVHAAAQI